MTEQHVSNPTHATPAKEAGPSKSVIYAGFALLAILFIAVLAYNYTQFNTVQQQLSRLSPAADKVAALETQVKELAAKVPTAANFQLLYDSSCEFCDNELLLKDAQDWNYEYAPKNIQLVPSDVKDKMDVVRNVSIPFLPAVLVLDPDARKNAYSWDFVKSESSRGPVFVKIEGGYYGALSTEGHPRPMKLTAESCEESGKLTIDYFYGLRCPLCPDAEAAVEGFKQAMGDKVVVRKHCLPADNDEAQSCARKEGAAAANETVQMMNAWSIGYSPTVVFDCGYALATSSMQKMADGACLLHKDLCDQLKAATPVTAAPTPEANATATNATNSTA